MNFHLTRETTRGLTRFVGRDAEVEHLRRVLTQADSGRGQVVAVVGEAGVGKSRLTYEFTHSHRVQEWLILHASSVSYGKATSYLPVIDLLKGNPNTLPITKTFRSTSPSLARTTPLRVSPSQCTGVSIGRIVRICSWSCRTARDL